MLKEAKVLIERWRRHYNTVQPHDSLGYCPPAPEAIAVPRQRQAALCGLGTPLRPPLGGRTESV